MPNKKVINLDCQCCGGQLIKLTETHYKCDHCGNEEFLETNVSAEIITLLNQANLLRNKGEFDEAYDTFNLIAKKDVNNPDAYFGMFLSKYGFMHVEDPVSKKYIPTCNRASQDKVQDDENYIKAISLSNDMQKSEYERKGEMLEKIRLKVVELARHESPYDIFICYKRTQEVIDGKETYTEDAINARDIYELLIDKGYKVFFAEKTLQNLAGTEYEPIIYNALNTSKVMLVVCSDPDLINTPWVKNEWRRFLKQMEFDENKKLVPIMCGGLKASRLPDALKKFQGLEMNATFQTSLINSVAKYIELGSRSKISKINIGQSREIKKSRVVKDNIQIRKIGNKEQVKFVISDEKIIKLIFSYIEKNMFKEAQKELKLLSNDDKLNSIKSFVNDYIQFKSKESYCDFIDSMNKCIESSSSSVVNIIFDCLENDMQKYIINGDSTRGANIYCALMTWDNGRHERIFNFVDDYLTTSKFLSVPLIRAVAKCYNNKDLDDYLDLFGRYYLRAQQSFDIYNARICVQSLLEVEEGNIEARWRHFLLSFGAFDVKDIEYVVHNLRPKNILEDFKDFLTYVPEKDRSKYVFALAEGIIRGVKYIDDIERLKADSGKGFLSYYVKLLTHNFNYPIIKERDYLAQNSIYFFRVPGEEKFLYPKSNLIAILKNKKKTLTIGDKKADFIKGYKIDIYTQIFDEVIKFFTNEDNEELADCLYMMAEACKEQFEFKVAQHYYNLMLSEKNTYHEAFWGLLQCKLKCSVEEDLKCYAQKLSKYEEYNNAVHSAGISDDEDAVNKYLSYQQAQKTKTKHKKRVVKKERQKGIFKFKLSIILKHLILFALFHVYYLLYLAWVKPKNRKDY